MAEDRDNTLVQKIKRGDEHAFNILVDRHKKKAFSIAYNFVNNIEEAKELSQEAFLRVHKSINKFNEKSSFYTWFYRILINLCIDHKKKKSLNSTPFSQIPGKRFEGRDNPEDHYEDKQSPQPVDRIISKELNKKIEKAMTFLSENQRKVFVLRTYEQMTIKEIAGLMSCREGTIKSHLHRAIKNLKRKLHGSITETQKPIKGNNG